jgi:zinc transport system substrate-binding protein
MRHALIVSAVLTLSLSLNSYAKTPSVAVDIAPIHSLVSQVMEGVGRPNLLIPAGASPHQYTLRPSEAKALADAEVVFWVGEGLTPWLEKSLDNLAVSAQKIEVLKVSGTTTYPFREGATFEPHDDGGEEEGNDDAHAFEWASAFKLDAGEYVWTFAKVDGDYADPEMKLVFLASNLDGEVAKEYGEKTPEILIESLAIEKVHGDILTANDSNAYQLIFDNDKNLTEFRIVINKKGVYTFFAEHAPSEFEAGEHFFQTVDQRDIEPLAQESGADVDEHHHHDGVDPHAWLDPENAKIWVNEINQVLSKHDPQNAKVYDHNAKQAIAELNTLIVTTRKKINSIEGLKFIVFHDAYQYFEKRFGISAAGSIALGDAEDPSPARIKEIRDTVKEIGVTCVFTEPQYNPGLVENVFEGTTVSVIGVMDPLGASLPVGNSHYQQLIQGMVMSLSQCK